MGTLDVNLLEQAVSFAEQNPERHLQDFWAVKLSCGTAGCIAGITVLLKYPEAQFVFHKPWYEEGDQQVAEAFILDGVKYNIQDEARRALGLSRVDASELFGGGNSIETLRQMADQLIEYNNTHGYDSDEDCVLSEDYWI